MLNPQFGRESEERIFSEALDLPSGKAQEELLDRRCGGDGALRERVSGLLRAYQASDGFMDEAAFARPSELPEGREDIGDRIHSYLLLRRLGEGGYGVVYLAEQSVPIRRQVAVKVLKLGMDTRAVLARFEAERQMLALLDHHSIAKIIEAGSTQAGAPFYAMEFVDGRRITDFAEEQALTVQARIELVIEVCHAVEHAHQRGIIHRDLKPSNVLVVEQDGVPIPKVIDFGIAKATTESLGANTLTMPGQVLGTPAYMSPEQLESGGADIDTRTDVYSLGVILHELLTGSVPFKPLENETVDAFRRRTSLLDPRKPSTTLSARAAKPDNPACLPDNSSVSTLRGDLDAILLKALARERSFRYRSAAELADDLKRFLRHEPVQARIPGPFYRMGKFARRHRALSAALLAVLAVLLASGTLILNSWRNEQNALRTAAHAANDLRLNLYCADMELASQAYAAEDLGRMRELLKTYRDDTPAPFELRLFSPLTLGGEVFDVFIERGSLVGGGIDANSAIITLTGDCPGFFRRQAPGVPVATFGKSEDPAIGVLFSPNKTMAMVSRTTGPCELWDLQRQEILYRGPKHGYRFAFHPAQPLVAMLQAPPTGERKVTVYDFGADRVINAFVVRGNALDFSMNGEQIIVSDAKNGISLWDWHSGAEIATFEAELSDVHLIRAAPNQPVVARATSCCGIDLWNYKTRQKLGEFLGNGFAIRSINFSPDGRLLVACSADQSVTLFDTQNWNILRRLIGHGGGALFADFAPDGKRLLTAARDGRFRFWDISPPSETNTLGALWFTAPCFAPDSRRIVGWRLEGSVEVWDVKPVRPIAKLVSSSIPQGFTSQDTVLLWQEEGDFSLAEWHYLSEAAPRAPIFSWRGQRGRVFAVDPPAKMAVVGIDGIYELCDLSMNRKRPLQGVALKSPVHYRSGGFSLDHSRVAFPASTTQIGLWDTTSGRLLRVFEHPGFPIEVALSRDGKLLAACGGDNDVYVWDTTSGRLWRTLKGNRTEAYGVTFTPDSKTLITSGLDQTVRFYNLATGREAGLLKSSMWVDRTFISPDQNWLLTMERFQPRLWKLAPESNN